MDAINEKKKSDTKLIHLLIECLSSANAKLLTDYFKEGSLN